ncbi:MAG TPA: PA domain-containing protein [Gaiellaceae bacterium]|nr:PA domain-containing protein [Gaiellaceae bacterium]
MRRRAFGGLVALATMVLVAAAPASGVEGGAGAQQGSLAQAQALAQANPNFRVIGDDVADSPVEIHGMKQHGMEGGHLPGSSENVTLLGRVDIDRPGPGRVADVAAYGNYAYLAVRDPEGCYDAGFAVIDMKDPRNPKQVGFIDWTDGSFPGEGAQVLDMNTKFFKGQLLLGNNEICDEETGEGGLTLWNVTNPLAPVQLTAHAGDPDAGIFGLPHEWNHIHSVFAWQDKKRAFAVMTDNMEFTDVDIMEITDPRNPKLLSELDLNDFDVAQEELLVNGNFQGSFLHDMVVKKIGGVQTMLLSYWDGGWVKLNVNDPANPTFIDDSEYPYPDTLFPSFPFPEGNAHQAEFSKNSKFIIGTDEDFSPYRLTFSITTGPNAGEYAGGEFGWTVPVNSYPGSEVNGPTIYGGLGCPASYGTNPPIPNASALPAAAGEEKIVVLLRGVCFFSEKVEEAQNAGYDAVIVANSHAGSGNGAFPDAALCGAQGHEFTPTIAGLCTGHRAFHLLFGQTPTYTGADEPALGTLGEKVHGSPEFDGWGYVRLLDNDTLEEIDAYAVDEAMDEAYASGFGDLSVHEVAVDPYKKNLAYLSYYAAGLRVIEYGKDGLEEVGHYVDEGGNNFWGVEVHKLRQLKKPTVILASDRDSGLWIFQYWRN